VELAPATAVVCSLDFEDSLEDASFTAYPRTASLRFEPSGAAVLTAMGKAGGGGVVGSASSRFAFSVSDNALKPWYLSTTPAAAAPLAGPRSVVPSSSPSLVGASPLSARSFSFASPAARSTPQPVQQHRGGRVLPTPSAAAATPKGHSKAPAPAPLSTPPPQQQQFPRTPRPSFLQSPFTFRKDGQASRGERERESFLPFLRFYRRPYDEISYRARMRPPLGGLIAIVDDKFRQKPVQQQPRRHAAVLHHHHQYQQQHHHHNHHHQRI
jgi:hypothetical protein